MLEDAAGKAELTGQIRSLVAWVGPGRKLTQTGRVGLADARHLVELLGTGDTIDPVAVDVTIAMAALHVLGVVVLDREADSAGLTELGRYAIRRVRGMAQTGDPVLQVRVTLADVDGPPVWRQVVIPAGYTLDRVHSVIQAAMGVAELSPAHVQDRRPGIRPRVPGR